MSEIKENEIEVLFGIRRSVRYHNRRRMFFDRFHIVANAFGAVFGSATIFAILSEAEPVYSISAAAIVTVFSAINLVVGTSTRARLHLELSRRFIKLEQEYVQKDSLTDKDIKSLTAQRLDIEVDEPPVLRVLDSLCHNELMRAMGYDKKDFLVIKWYQSWFAQFIDIRDHLIVSGN